MSDLDPSRVFSNFLEFEVGYERRRPLNESWSLVRDWEKRESTGS